MDCTVDRLPVFFGHTFDPCDSDSLTVFVRMPLLIEQGNNTLFSVGNVLDHHFNCVFSVLVQNLKICTEIVEMLSEWSIAIGNDELDTVFMAVCVDEFLSLQRLLSHYDDVVLFQNLQIIV